MIKVRASGFVGYNEVMGARGVQTAERIEVICPCGKTFLVRRKRYEDGRGRRCSKECQYKYATRPSGLTYVKHRDNPTQFQPGLVPWNKGTRGVMVAWNKGLKTGVMPPNAFQPGETAGAANPRWAGEDVRYGGLHTRLRRERGKASDYVCAHADNTCKGPMHWASISHEYRSVEDFMPLCQSHHIRYDKASGTWGTCTNK